jgi:hypothetical protein
MSRFCCDRMKLSVDFECDEHESPFECPDSTVYYDAPFAEYGLIVHDGGGSTQKINFCPWCGSRLPESKRDEWFDVLEELGFDDPIDEDIPKEFQSDKWWLTRIKRGR